MVWNFLSRNFTRWPFWNFSECFRLVPGRPFCKFFLKRKIPLNGHSETFLSISDWFQAGHCRKFFSMAGLESIRKNFIQFPSERKFYIILDHNLNIISINYWKKKKNTHRVNKKYHSSQFWWFTHKYIINN